MNWVKMLFKKDDSYKETVKDLFDACKEAEPEVRKLFNRYRENLDLFSIEFSCLWDKFTYGRPCPYAQKMWETWLWDICIRMYLYRGITVEELDRKLEKRFT
jgi:hypothetical protein